MRMLETPPASTRPSDETAGDSKFALLLFPLIGLIAVLPLMVKGCSCGHDFDFHVVSWVEAAAQFRHGHIYPRWAFSPAFNAGEPRFVFYPPLSWSIGAILGMLLPWIAAPIVYTWLALTGAGLACHHLLRHYVRPNTAFLLASIYAVNPYMLFTAFERTAFAELLTATWLPLILYAVLRERVQVLPIAIPVALVWLTNPPAAVLGCYSLAIIAVARLITTLRGQEECVTPPTRLIGNSIGGTALGLGLASFYLVPAAFQRRYVDVAMASAQSFLIGDNFLFHHTSDAAHDAVLHTASVLAVSLLLASTVSLVIALRSSPKRTRIRNVVHLLSVLTLVIAFLLTPLSAPIWHHAPVLAYMQFPWRFLAMLMPALALSLAIACRGVHLTRVQATAISVALASALTVAGYHAFAQACDAEDTVTARLQAFRAETGTEGTDEYTPNNASDEALGQANPPFWLARDSNASAPPAANAGLLRWPVDITSPIQQTLILNLRDYPAWRIQINHRVVTTRMQRDDGLVAIPLPAGTSHLDIEYVVSRDEIAGRAISAASLGILVFVLIDRRKRVRLTPAI